MQHRVPRQHKDHPENKHFELLQESSGQKRMRGKMERKEMLTPAESMAMLVSGTPGHRMKLLNFQGTLQGDVNKLVILCADARLDLLDFDDFAKKGVLPIFVAGNISKVLNTPGMKEIFGRMAEGSSIIIVGHSRCGVVHGARHKENYRSLEHVSGLLNEVEPDAHENIASQARKLAANPDFKKAAAEKGISIVTAHADISHGEPTIRCSGPASDEDKKLISGMEKHLRASSAGQDLSQPQYAHAVVITGQSLHFDPRQIFGCGPNEIFCVSAGDFGKKTKKGEMGAEPLATAEMAATGLLDASAIGSAEYSVTANLTRHIVLLHTDLEVANAWEMELITKSPTIAKAVLDGALEISTAVYDSQTGMVTFMRHLENVDASALNKI